MLAGPRTWTFAQDTKILAFESTGQISVRKGGRFTGEFLRFKDTNAIVVLSALDAHKYLIALTNLSAADVEFLAKAESLSAADETALKQRIEVDQAVVKIIANDRAQRSTAKAHAEAEARKSQEAAIDEAEKRKIGRYASLLDGRPLSRLENNYYSYETCVRAVANVSHHSNPSYQLLANQILQDANDITDLRLAGHGSQASIQISRVEQNLRTLIDEGVLPP